MGRQVRLVEAAWGMVVHGPAADRDGILKPPAHQILLSQNVVAHQSAAAAFAGHHPDPLHRPIAAVRKVAAVLDVVPNAHYDGEQLKADTLTIVNDVLIAAPF